MTNPDSAFPHIEWEWLHEPAEFKNVELQAPIALHVDKLTIQRDPDYALYAIIEQQEAMPVVMSPLYNLFHPNKPVTLSFNANRDRVRLVLSGCVCIHARQSGSQGRELATTTLTIFTQKIIVDQVKPQESPEAGWMTEWFLNGLSEITLFRGKTDRKLSRTLLRQRGDPSVSGLTSDNSITKESRSFSSDFFPVSLDQWKILITQVPEGIGPAWSNNIGIEYLPDENGLFPPDPQRDAISELVSFFFGKQLVRIGSTIYDENGYFITRISYQKLHHPYPQRFNSGHLPPVKFPELGSQTGLGEQIAELLPMYLQLRTDLGINEILYNLWQADKDPLESKIPTLVTGIELLAKRWFDSQHSAIRGVYLPKPEYEALIAPEMESLKGKFEAIPDGGKILNKINSAYNMSSSDRYRRLLNELNLPTGEVEEKVFRDRNKYSHGHTLSSDEEIKAAILLSRAARSLFNRIVLRMLNYPGPYIDYYAEGQPARSLDTPLGG